jgi:hypothetical protein
MEERNMTDQLPNTEQDLMGIFKNFGAKEKGDYIFEGMIISELYKSKVKFLSIDNYKEIIQSLKSKGYIYTDQDGVNFFLTEKGATYLKMHP